ncbi:MAG: hypothetical protein ACRDBQ_18510 [Shewanella sp.]
MSTELKTRTEFERERVLEIEREFIENLYPFARFTESMFRNMALPILVGLIDGNFSEEAYIRCVGSPMVGLDVVSDRDTTQILFRIPPLYYSGPSVQMPEDQPSLTEEAAQIDLQGEIISSVGEEARAEFIMSVVDGIDEATYDANYKRAYDTITLLNNIFQRYGIAGRMAYPEGLKGDAFESSTEEKNVGRAVQAAQDFGSIEDDEFL